MTDQHLLLVDDDEIFGDVLSDALRRRDFTVVLSRSVREAMLIIETGKLDFAIIDLRIGNDSGLQLVELLAETNPNAKTIVLTGYGSIATAVEAIKLGAVHYLTKPTAVDDIIAALQDMPGDSETPPADRPPSVRRMEWEHIQKVLAEHDGNISATARALGMHRRTLQRKLKKRPVRE